MSKASTEVPEKGTYSKVVMNDSLNPETAQSYGFYEGIIESRNIEYKGEKKSLLFLKTQAQVRSLFYRGHGWMDITEDWFKFLERKEQNAIKEDMILIEKPIKAKRGRPRKKVK